MPSAEIFSPQYAGSTPSSRQVKTTEQITPHRVCFGTLVTGTRLTMRRRPMSRAEMTTSFHAC